MYMYEGNKKAKSFWYHYGKLNHFHTSKLNVVSKAHKGLLNQYMEDRST